MRHLDITIFLKPFCITGGVSFLGIVSIKAILIPLSWLFCCNLQRRGLRNRWLLWLWTGKALWTKVAELVPKHQGRTKKQEPSASASGSSTPAGKSGKSGKKKRWIHFRNLLISYFLSPHCSAQPYYKLRFQVLQALPRTHKRVSSSRGKI